MGCLGVHFALTQADVAVLEGFEDEADRVEHVQEVIEEQYLEGAAEFAAESDKAWDAMHRALSDGLLTWDGGAYPLNHAVLGGRLLYTGSDYIMSLKSPAQVADIAAALQGITQVEFRRRYDFIDADGYGFPLTEDDFEYTWNWFERVRNFYVRAARAGRCVLFTADQ